MHRFGFPTIISEGDEHANIGSCLQRKSLQCDKAYVERFCCSHSHHQALQVASKIALLGGNLKVAVDDGDGE